MRRPTPLPPTAPPAAVEPASDPTVSSTLDPTVPASPDPTVTSSPDPTVSSSPDPTVSAAPEPRIVEPVDGVTISPSDAVATDNGADTGLAPVIPLTAPAPLPGMTTPLPGMTEPEGSDPAGETSADQPPVRLRDVWRAARARRRALRAEVRRFTVRQRRRRMLWIGVAASVLLLVLTTLAAAYSPLFGVERIRVVGTSLLDAAAVEDALADQLGTPLPLVDESAVKADLIAFPLVQTYSLEARPPHELVVRIVERLPVGLMQTRAGYTLVDAAGVALSTTETPAPGRPLLSITGGTNSSAFEAVGQVMRTLPATIRDQVTAISASTPDDVTLTLGGTNTQVVWGSADESAMKALVLEKIMQQRPPETVSAYDVSSPAAAVVR
jgi:cell division protein FtsQ